MNTTINAFPDLLEILDNLRAQCADARDSNETAGNLNLADLWQGATMAINDAVLKCEYERDHYMKHAKAKP